MRGDDWGNLCGLVCTGVNLAFFTSLRFVPDPLRVLPSLDNTTDTAVLFWRLFDPLRLPNRARALAVPGRPHPLDGLANLRFALSHYSSLSMLRYGLVTISGLSVDLQGLARRRRHCVNTAL